MLGSTQTQRQMFQITENSFEIILENSYSGTNSQKSIG